MGCKPKGSHHPSTYIETDGLFWYLYRCTAHFVESFN